MTQDVLAPFSGAHSFPQGLFFPRKGLDQTWLSSLHLELMCNRIKIADKLVHKLQISRHLPVACYGYWPVVQNLSVANLHAAFCCPAFEGICLPANPERVICCKRVCSGDCAASCRGLKYIIAEPGQDPDFYTGRI